MKKSLGINDVKDDDDSASSMDAEPEKETKFNKVEEELLQKCSFTKLKSKKPLNPVTILCVHPSPPNQLLVHWKPTTALPISGYEVNFPYIYTHTHTHVTLLWLTPQFLPQIDIDGVPAAKTYSQIRTSALLYDVNLKQNHLITIYAFPCPEDPHPDPIFCTPGCFYYQPNSSNCCRCPTNVS